MPTPQELSRQNINEQLVAGGWMSELRREDNLCAGCNVAIGEFPVDTDGADD